MDESGVKLDKVIAELVDMGFRFSRIIEAVNAVGPSVDAAIDYIFNDSRDNEIVESRSSDSLTEKENGKRGSSLLNPSRPMKQLKLSEVIKTADTELVNRSSNCIEEEDIAQDWELRVANLMLKHFGFSSLKSFQKEALAAWIAHQDCLVLAATGSGKSLCFQIPALLTGKVVVVISPLISLMHDQCMKLAKHGVSSCYLGSGQKDSTVEEKAMRGVYDIIYICPETLVRLIKPLQELATKRGIALFAIDEVHCISKWGHDFRPEYRRLSVLRENFRTKKLKCLKFDIPLMALTATATIQVREEILESLHMSEETRTVLTSFFRPNLRFSVKNSRTRDPFSYDKDFRELINIYTRKNTSDVTQDLISPELVYASDYSCSTSSDSSSESFNVLDGIEDDPLCGSGNRVSFQTAKSVLKERNMSVEYLEDECDLLKDVNDLDVPCAEFFGQLPVKANYDFEFSVTPERPKESPEVFEEPQGLGPTIIYVPTRRETLEISEFICSYGVRAAAYNAKLPKSHLRQVHKEFHENSLEVVVATIAFGMGIDKSNVRRIIHYGWPQSLEAYHQEAGRAGRDGKWADCVLYADFSAIPTLLPSRRTEEHAKRANKMLSDCFRYGMNLSCCRAKTLVQYFGEEFNSEKCHMCDVCINGPPKMQDLKDEVKIFMQAIAQQKVDLEMVIVSTKKQDV
ncbi:ATP-dependent DNA helicase Q-like SIM isoform X2 [Apium graveolens]|uniref:ATP-dependent DNA helicase Q-like SIM isoform X2 n=1 Tax=Apium graveolens TaxID=4045 RepID=UPI003D78D251